MESKKRDGSPGPGEPPINTDAHPASDVVGSQQHDTVPANDGSDREPSNRRPAATEAELDERAMDAADEAGSALLPHDKILSNRKDD
ncbi:MAG: hypothetical protein ABR606_03295 [Vicinamibacterales bacterium]